MVIRTLRTTARKALVLAAAGTMAVTGVIALPGTASRRDHTRRLGRRARPVLRRRRLPRPSRRGAVRRTRWTTEFNGVTPENEMKWQTIEPNPNQFNFGPANQIVSQARSRGMAVRGHTLVWHSQLAGWVNSLDTNGLRSAMTNHINRVMGNWRGQIHSWDVVNEAFEENGSRRQSVFQQRLGNGFMEEAFRLARAADPAAKLCYNDYNTDGINAKSNAVFATGAGLQEPRRADRLRRFPVALQPGIPGAEQLPGRTCSVSPTSAWTCRSPSSTSRDPARHRPTTTRNVVNACLAVSRCTGITVWGIPDHYSWRASGTPLLFNNSYQKKPAYTSVLNALNNGTTPPPTDPPPTTGACSATVSTNQWPGGFVGTVRVTAGSAQISRWTVGITFPSGATLVNSWNANRSGNSGAVQFTNDANNGSLAAGQTVEFGYQGTGTGTGVTPTCTV